MLFDHATHSHSKMATFYQIAAGDVEAARCGHQTGVEKHPIFVANFHWINAIVIITQLVDNGLVSLGELDPLRLSRNSRNALKNDFVLNERIIQVLVQNGYTLVCLVERLSSRKNGLVGRAARLVPS